MYYIPVCDLPSLPQDCSLHRRVVVESLSSSVRVGIVDAEHGKPSNVYSCCKTHTAQCRVCE